MRALMKAGANPLRRYKKGLNGSWTAAVFAIQSDNVEMLKVLLESGVSANHRPDGNHPLLINAIHSHKVGFKSCEVNQ